MCFVYETFEHLWNTKENNNNADWLLLTSLGKVMKELNNNWRFQMSMENTKVPKYATEEKPPPAGWELKLQETKAKPPVLG